MERLHWELHDHQDSPVSTTNNSFRAPIEKPRGISEIIRKRNSRSKVEDYKRSFQRSNTFDEQICDYYRPSTTSKIDEKVISTSADPLLNAPAPVNGQNAQSVRGLIKTKSFDISSEIERNIEQKQNHKSIARSNPSLNKIDDEPSNE